ncbi:hypothetical protein Tco_0596807 [Tanacetum coccineum]
MAKISCGISTLLIGEGRNGVAAKLPNEVGGATGAETGKAAFKCMTKAEIADKRAKGLCYRCDGKFGPGHWYTEKALQVLWVGEDEDEKEEDEALFPP